MKCSKSKTIRHIKLKSSHHVYLITSTWCELLSCLGLIVLDLEHFKVLGGLVFCCSPFIFQLCNFVAITNLRSFFGRKIWLLAHYCRPESFARKSLLPRKFSTFLPLGHNHGLADKDKLSNLKRLWMFKYGFPMSPLCVNSHQEMFIDLGLMELSVGFVNTSQYSTIQYSQLSRII